ncbi:HNH endonuclease signature motif containing protein [Mycobacterium sp. 1274756.6]|uniref:HNH endonuclease signature motif containing protein n=1 Tax=Mycobacterium sp. 1274756.6 TaxID=1834076 RepID=UPI00080194FB|nr:HNH endonuclease signature motif containing protein [Mycobacterium sp. 1274756.6]OBJ72207.1 hypothetical protein A5643_06015 [Mycobacterium sp. 1274756.6]
MRSSSREEVVEVFDALSADLSRALNLSFDALTTPERLNLLERLETLRRQLPALERPLINELTHADPDELGGKLRWALADRLHITRGEAKQRIDETADLHPRRRFDGQPQPPLLPTTAAAAAAGRISSAHIHIIRDFWHHLPHDVLPEMAANAEKHLANLACQYRPDELAKLAACLADCLNPDGLFSDVDRARRRNLTLSRQDADGMSNLTATLTPTARAALDAVLARWAAPGMCNPTDPTPCVDGTPSQAAIDNDDRTTGQRNHDALAALATAMLASGQLGTHNGLPATIVVTTTLAELETPPRTKLSGGAKAHTGGGTWLPMSDVIKLAAQAHHYLAIFDGAKPLALYHANRLANTAQRLLLYATERGCTHPGCTVGANCTEVHHITPYAQQPRTHADELTLRCGPHHRLLNSGR